MKPEVDIVLLTLNQLEYTKKCVDSILKKTPIPYRLIFLDNGSSDGTQDWLIQLREQLGQDRVGLFFNPSNLGVSKAWNLAIDLTDAPILVFLNNDTIVTSAWLEELIKPFYMDSKVAVAGSSLEGQWVLQAQASGDGREAAGIREIDDEELERNAAHLREKYQDAPYQDTADLWGFSMAVRKQVFEKVGFFDEDFFAYCEEADFCLRCKRAGFRTMQVLTSIVFHYNAITSGSQRGEMHQRSIAKLKDKWGSGGNGRNKICLPGRRPFCYEPVTLAGERIYLPV